MKTVVFYVAIFIILVLFSLQSISHEIVQITDDSSADWNPLILIDHQNQIWVFWQSNRTEGWDIYAKTFSGGEWSDIIRVTNNSTISSLCFSAVIDFKDNVWLAWHRIRFSNVYFKHFDGNAWSGTDSLEDEGTGLKLLSGDTQKLWLFYTNIFGDIVCKDYQLDQWSDPDTILEHFELSWLMAYYYFGPIGTSITIQNRPWILCKESGGAHGGFEWDDIHLTFWQDSVWIDQVIASAVQTADLPPNQFWIQPHDLGSDRSGNIYAAYTYHDTSGSHYFLKSFNGEIGSYRRRWMLEPGCNFRMSDGASALGISWSNQSQIYARILSDTMLFRPVRVSYDSTITDNDASSNAFDALNNLWIAWQGNKSDNNDIFATVIPFDTLLLTAIKFKQEPNDLDFVLTEVDNYPNPFNSQTTIRFNLESAANVLINIFNIHGQLVKSFPKKYLPKGRQLINWDGKNNFGQEVSAGIYFLIVKKNNQLIFTKKLVLIK